MCLLYGSFFVLRALTGGIESMPNQSTAFDVAIIGAGIVGCAAAFELSKTTARVALLDRSNDVGTGTTRANSGIIHAGYDPEPGTRMARFNVEGNALTRQLAGELRVPFVGNGSLVVALSEEDLPVLRGLYERGQANGVPGLELLSGEEARRREPALAGEVCGALWAPTAGIISPWEMAIALADTAVVNGCEFHGGCAVTGIEREADGFRLHTTGGDFLARRVINAAGTHADAVNAFVAAPYFRIQPSKGQYYLLDKSQGELVGATVFQCPSAAGKGVLVSPTVHGNLIVGPDAIPAAGPDDVAVTAQGLSFVAGMALSAIKTILSGRKRPAVPGSSTCRESSLPVSPRPPPWRRRRSRCCERAALSCRSGRDSACIPGRGPSGTPERGIGKPWRRKTRGWAG